MAANPSSPDSPVLAPVYPGAGQPGPLPPDRLHPDADAFCRQCQLNRQERRVWSR